MNAWTKPKAYIVGMTGAQTRATHQALMLKAEMAYLAYRASLEPHPAP